jgi:high-affinity nickel-transport protein
MNLAYGWAFFNPVRKVYYNLAITGLSVAICFFIGGVEVLGLFREEIMGLSQGHGFWGFMANFNVNTAGFVIVGMFILTWLTALLVWRYGQIEKKWTARLQPATAAGIAHEPAAIVRAELQDGSG